MTPQQKTIQIAAKEIRRAIMLERDILPEEAKTEAEALVRELDQTAKATQAPSEEETQKIIRRAEKNYSKLFPGLKLSGWAENIDVVLVAFIVALGVRSFFLQPFKIPTNSMYPTLNGVVITDMKPEEKSPTGLQAVAEKLLFGRNYVEFALPAGARVVGLTESGFWVFHKTTLKFKAPDGSFTTYAVSGDASVQDLFSGLHLDNVSPAPRNIRAVVHTGDHLFVNKVAYNLHLPERADTFVFRTTGLQTEYNRQNPKGGSQFYIKRCVGTPGDSLRVVPPELLVNGQPAVEAPMRRVIDQKEPGYKGYSHGAGPQQIPGTYLRTDDEEMKLAERRYWAMGDNSYNSADSRYFGAVPLENIVGKAAIIYYPFDRFLQIIK